MERDETSSWSQPLVIEHEGRKQAVVSASNRTRSYDLKTGEASQLPGRRPANYWYKTERTGSKQLGFEGAGFAQEQQEDLPLVNRLREDVRRWRESGPMTSSMSSRSTTATASSSTRPTASTRSMPPPASMNSLAWGGGVSSVTFATRAILPFLMQIMPFSIISKSELTVFASGLAGF